MKPAVVETISPSGVRMRYTLSIVISPDLNTNKLGETQVLHPGVKLTETGDYRFVVTPQQNTVGVWSAAIELVR